MSFEFFLAKRFLFGQRFGIFRFIVSAIAIGGTALGVAALLITLAVMDGFRTDIQEKILGTQPQMIITNPVGRSLPQNDGPLQLLASQNNVQAAAPFIYGQALLQSGSSVTGIMLRGIVPETEAGVTHLSDILTQGKWSDLDDHAVILGQELATSVSAHVGDTITLVAPQSHGSALGQTPRMRQYKVVGLFRSGMYEYDANLAYLRLDGAQDLLDLHQPRGHSVHTQRAGKHSGHQLLGALLGRHEPQPFLGDETRAHRDVPDSHTHHSRLQLHDCVEPSFTDD